MKVSFPTANTAIEQLVATGILRDIDKIGRSRAFVAHAVITRLDRPVQP